MIEKIITALISKDLLIAVVVILILMIIIIPLVKWIINEKIEKIEVLIKNNHEGILKTIKGIEKTSLTRGQTVRLFKSEMWLTSRQKIAFLRSILINNHIKGREEFIKKKIREGLIWYSDEYLSNFKWFDTPVGDLWIWLNGAFWENEFDNFIEEIALVVFRDDWSSNKEIVNDKVNEISLIMETLQNNLANKLKLKMG